jgi:hypothetical protein
VVPIHFLNHALRRHPDEGRVPYLKITNKNNVLLGSFMCMDPDLRRDDDADRVMEIIQNDYRALVRIGFLFASY